MPQIAYRPYQGCDLEECLESYAMQSALLDILGNRLTIVNEFPKDVTHAFGRMSNRFRGSAVLTYPAGHYLHLDYWTWEAFRQHSGRKYQILDLFSARDLVSTIHLSGTDAFVKSTRNKELATRVPLGANLIEYLNGMAYVFADRGPCLMVQPHVEMTYEYRLFVINGVAVTGAGAISAHTPADNTAIFNPAIAASRTEECPVEMRPDIVKRYLAFAADLIPQCPVHSFVLDVALVDGDPIIVEFNPLHLGQVGLFATRTDLIASATLQALGLIQN